MVLVSSEVRGDKGKGVIMRPHSRGDEQSEGRAGPGQLRGGGALQPHAKHQEILNQQAESRRFYDRKVVRACVPTLDIPLTSPF